MNIFDLYTDYLQITPGLATATALSNMLDKAVSYDQVTRMLVNHEFDSKALWRIVKPLVREHEHIDGCLIFDNTILHKPYSDKSEVVCWYHDHAVGRNVKAINLLTTFYYSQNGEQPLKLPVAFDIVTKYAYCTIKDRKELRKSSITKNELMRNQILHAIKNQIKFSYIFADSWFSSGENMKFTHLRKNILFLT